MLHAYALKFDVIKNLEKFLVLGELRRPMYNYFFHNPTMTFG